MFHITKVFLILQLFSIIKQLYETMCPIGLRDEVSISYLY